MLINAFNVISDVRNWRSVWLNGFQGSGKTAFAFRMAYELLASGQVNYLTSNIPNVWNTRPENIPFENGALNTVCILDEGGFMIRTKSDTDAYLTALRKLNVILIVASRRAPASEICRYRIQRIMNLKSVGLNLWVYKYLVNDGMTKENGTFLWYNPSEIFGVYDTDLYPVTDGGIGYALEDAIKNITVENDEEKTRFNQFRNRGFAGSPTVLNMEEILEGFESSVSDASQISEDISISINKIKKQRRF